VEYLIGSISRDRRGSNRDDNLTDLISSFHVSVSGYYVVEFERAVHSRSEDASFNAIVDERDSSLHRSFIASQAQGLGTGEVEHHVKMELNRFDPQIVQRRRQVLAASDAIQNQVTAWFDDSPKCRKLLSAYRIVGQVDSFASCFGKNALYKIFFFGGDDDICSRIPESFDL